MRPSSMSIEEDAARLHAARAGRCVLRRDVEHARPPSAITTTPSLVTLVARAVAGRCGRARRRAACRPSNGDPSPARPRAPSARRGSRRSRAAPADIDSWFSTTASGIIIITALRQRAAGLQRAVPARCSKVAVSLWSGRHEGKSFAQVVAEPAPTAISDSGGRVIAVDVAAQRVDLPVVGDVAVGVRSGHEGKVLVLKREWTSASADSKSGSIRSGNIASIWSAISIPL